jgi:LPXTG-motif cell wall-anchored protein
VKIDKTSESISIWIILVGITIIILAVIVLFLLIRKKKSKKKLQAKETVTIEPLETPTPKPTLEKPPIAKLEVQIPAKPTVDTSSQLTPSTTPKPTLAASTIVGQVPIEQQMLEVEQKPQLPPPAEKTKTQ